jgi:hypothetical protein
VKTDSILTENQNIEWISKFEKLNSKPEQIIEAKKKILADTIYKRPTTSCRIIIQSQESIEEARAKENCECKIVFVLGFKKSAYLLEPIEYPKTNRILELVTEKNIDKITVLKGDIASALYGTNGRCGVVVMYSDSRKFKRKIKNVL